jgi:hypothetical protein
MGAFLARVIITMLLGVTFITSGCTKDDFVVSTGKTLGIAKTVYESAQYTVADAYVQGKIDEGTYKRLEALGGVFFNSYTVASSAYSAYYETVNNKKEDPELRKILVGVLIKMAFDYNTYSTAVRGVLGDIEAFKQELALPPEVSKEILKQQAGK